MDDVVIKLVKGTSYSMVVKEESFITDEIDKIEKSVGRFSEFSILSNTPIIEDFVIRKASLIFKDKVENFEDNKTYFVKLLHKDTEFRFKLRNIADGEEQINGLMVSSTTITAF